jgi:hypothetical protein
MNQAIQRSSSIVIFLFALAFSAEAQTPIITSQPASRSVLAGSNVTFRVGATTLPVSNSVLPNVASGVLKLWLKADAGVITTNGRVSEWRDQSPNANHAFQSDPNKQPALVSGFGPLTNKPVVRFDGVLSTTLGDMMHGNGDLHLTNGFTSFLVYSEADPNVYEQIPSMIGEPGVYHSIRAHYIRNLDGIANEMCFATWTYDYGSQFTIPTGNYRIWGLRLNESKTRIEFFDTDGAKNSVITRDTSGLITPAAGYYVGGAIFGKLYHFKGDIAEVIYYNGTLSDSDRSSVENYLRQKYYGTVPAARLAYQWRFKTSTILGATNSALTLNNVQSTAEGNYSVVVSNAFGSVTSSNALLTVIQPNRAPVAISQLVSVNEDNALPIVLAATDADGDTLSYSKTLPANGTLTGTAPNLVYHPNPNFHGTDSFTFKANDGQVDSSVATVSINVLSVNDVPVASIKALPSFLFSENDPMTVVIAPCNTNAAVILDGSLSHDVENDPLQFTWSEGTNILATGSIVTNSFAVGTHIITLAVSDSSDTGVGSLTLEVITPAAAVAELALYLEDSSLAKKRQKPLAVSLNNAIASLSECKIEAAMNQLVAFENKVRDQVSPTNPTLGAELLTISGEILKTISPK